MRYTRKFKWVRRTQVTDDDHKHSRNEIYWTEWICPHTSSVSQHYDLGKVMAIHVGDSWYLTHRNKWLDKATDVGPYRTMTDAICAAEMMIELGQYPTFDVPHKEAA